MKKTNRKNKSKTIGEIGENNKSQNKTTKKTGKTYKKPSIAPNFFKIRRKDDRKHHTSSTSAKNNDRKHRQSSKSVKNEAFGAQGSILGCLRQHARPWRREG